MELTPRELGEYWRVAIFRFRALGTARIHTPPHTGFLGRWWAAGSGVSERVTAATLPMMADTTLPLTILPFVALTLLAFAASWLNGFRPDKTLFFFAAILAPLYFFVIREPRRRFRQLHEARLRMEEIQALKGATPKREKAAQSEESRNKLATTFQSVRGKIPLPPAGVLEREFLQFVQDALILRDLPPTVETEIRRTLPALGETVALLTVWDAAANEIPTNDSLARENLRRLARRVETLEAAVLEQLPALRRLLPALAADGPAAATDFNRFTALLAELQSVIAETASVSEAREEMSSARSAIPGVQQAVARRM